MPYVPTIHRTAAVQDTTVQMQFGSGGCTVGHLRAFLAALDSVDEVREDTEVLVDLGAGAGYMHLRAGGMRVVASVTFAELEPQRSLTTMLSGAVSSSSDDWDHQ